MIFTLIRYLFEKTRPGLNHGGRFISPYNLRTATDDEKLLIEAGVARSPQDARYLMEKHGTTAAGVLKVVRRRKRQTTPQERALQLIRRLDGHDPRDPYGKPTMYEPPIIPLQYRYRGKR